MPVDSPDPNAATDAADAGLLATVSAPTSATDLREGDRAGDYRIIRRIGGGAMGDVYEGEVAAIGKRVAIKVLKNVAAATEEAAERFLREARAVNKINHPNVLDVFAYGKLEDGRLYLVMDLLSGESLGARIRRAGALETSEFLETLRPICRALDAAHRAGIVHRDLKPENIFLAEGADGVHVYVLDFGIAKLLSDAAAGEGQVTLTGEGVWIGTPAYMSPEQWAADPASPQSDVYALGCTAFEMLNGSVPYKADSVPGIMQKHFNEEPPPIERDGGDLPDSACAAIMAALAKEPSDRPESALAFLEAVEGRGPTQAPASAMHIKWIAGAMAVAVAVVAVLLLWPRSEEPAEPSAIKPAASAAAIDDGETWSLTLTTVPSTAKLRVAGRVDAFGRLELSDLAHDEEVTVRVSLAGHARIERVFSRREEGSEEVFLSPVKGFEGAWRLTDGSLRVFEHGGNGVLVFQLETIKADPKFLRRFEFGATTREWVQFEGKVAFVDARAPTAESCNFELVSEYRFHPVKGVLQLNREAAAVRFRRGSRTCEIGARHRLGWENVERVKYADNEVRWAVSRGTGLIKYVTKDPGKLVIGKADTSPLRFNVGNVSGNEKSVNVGKGKGAKQRGRDAKERKTLELEKNRKEREAAAQRAKNKAKIGANPSRPANAPNSPAKQGKIPPVQKDTQVQKKAPKRKKK